MNRFVFVAPAFNASKTVDQMIASIAAQSYANWKIVLIDDVSSTEHVERQRKIISSWKTLLQTRESNQEIIYIENSNKCWEVKNVLKGISLCSDTDIVCRIDADDWLTDADALWCINNVYEHGYDVVWSAHRWSFSDKNISSAMPQSADPYAFPWVSSHLKTFRKSLINGIPDVNFRGEHGDYVRRAGDQAIYLPVLNRSPRRLFIPKVFYHYTIDDKPETYQTDDAIFQRDEAVFLRKRGYVSHGPAWENFIK